MTDVFAAFQRRTVEAPERELPDAELSLEIAALSRVRTRDVKLSPKLLELYLSETWHSRKKINASVLIWSAAVNLACALFDPAIVPADHVVTAAASRVLVSLAFIAAAFVMLRAPKPGSEGGLIIATSVLAFAVAGFNGLHMGTELLERYVVQAIFFGGTAVMAARITWRDTMLLAAAIVVMTTVFLGFQAEGHMSDAEKLQSVVFFDAGVVGLALAKRALKQLHYRVFILTMSDRLQLREIADVNQRLQSAARTDPLTGVPNRRRFDEAFEDCRLTTGPVALVMFDVDHFKSLNDTHGHRAGDRCLTAVAGLLRAGLRDAPDLLARFGGEEFVALLPGVGPEEAAVIAERLRAAVEARRLPNPGGVGGIVTVSAGVASAFSNRLDQLLGAADAALYEAKSAGRNAVRVADPFDRRNVA